MGEGGTPRKFLVGVCCPVLQILTLFQTKTCHFPHLFSDLASKIHTRFQTWLLAQLKASHQCRSQELIKFTRKFSLNDILWILLFLYYTFGVKKTDTFICSCGSLENHTQFKTKNVLKTIPFGVAHTPLPLPVHILQLFSISYFLSSIHTITFF